MARLVACLTLLGSLGLLGIALYPPLGLHEPALHRWFLSSVAGAGAILSFSLWRRAAPFGVLAFLFMVGGAAQLYMTQPLLFPAMRLQIAGKAETLMAALILMEGLAAAFVLWRTGLAAAAGRWRSGPGIARVVVFLLLSTGASVSLMGYAGRSAWAEYLLVALATCALAGVHLLMLVAISRVSAPLRLDGDIPLWTPSLLAVSASIALCWFAFQALPHVEDEYVYLFQARSFASGAVSVPAPPSAALPGLEYFMLQAEAERWYAVTAPGWPLLLALGTLLGAPWLVNPLLAGAAVWFGQAVASEWLGQRMGQRIALLMATSPWFLAASASYMPHTMTIALSLLAWWALLKATRGGHAGWVVLAGLAMGWIFAARQLDGLLVGALTGAWLLLAKGGGTVRALVYALGCIGTGSLYFLHNLTTTGSLLVSPLRRYLDGAWGVGANSYGFGAQIGPGGNWGPLDLERGHSLQEALVNLAHNLSALNLEMLGWSTGSLGLLLVWLLWGKRRPPDLAMLCLAAAVIIATTGYWFAGGFYIGPRYWFIALFPLLFLSGRGLQTLASRLGDTSTMRLDRLLLLSCTFALVVFTPWRGVTKYHQFGGFHATVREDLAAGRFGNAVVLVTQGGDIASALMLNDPWLPPDSPVFLADTPELDLSALRAAFPGRQIVNYSPQWSGR